MLDPWIIEEIRRREKEHPKQEEDPMKLPLEAPVYPLQQDNQTETGPPKPPESEEERGVVVVDFTT
jgi:hypothetical protein